jgi:hypothetical protein
MRGQTSLPALGFALLLLTGVLVLGVAVADGSLLDADRDAVQRQAAVDLSNRLVAPDSPLTTRANVLDETALANLTATSLHSQFGLANDADAVLTLDGKELAASGNISDGASITRLVLVERTGTRTMTPRFAATNTVTLPRRTTRATVRIHPANGTNVTTVRANDRVVLHDESGLRGRFDISLSPYRTTTLTFEAERLLSHGGVEITSAPTTTTKARLEVTVDG